MMMEPPGFGCMLEAPIINSSKKCAYLEWLKNFEIICLEKRIKSTLNINFDSNLMTNLFQQFF